MKRLLALFHRKPKPEPGTLQDPRVARMVVMQRAMGRRMRRQGKSILSKDKAYTPVNNIAPLREAQPAKPLYMVAGGKK